MCHCNVDLENNLTALHILMYCSAGYSPFKDRRPWLIKDERNPERLVSVVCYFGGIYNVEIIKNKSFTVRGPTEEFSEQRKPFTIVFIERFIILTLNTLLSRYQNVEGLDILDKVDTDLQDDWECPCCGFVWQGYYRYDKDAPMPCNCRHILDSLSVVLTRLFPTDKVFLSGQIYKVTRDYSELTVSTGTSYSYTFRGFDSFLGDYLKKEKIA